VLRSSGDLWLYGSELQTEGPLMLKPFTDSAITFALQMATVCQTIIVCMLADILGEVRQVS